MNSRDRVLLVCLVIGVFCCEHVRCGVVGQAKLQKVRLFEYVSIGHFSEHVESLSSGLDIGNKLGVKRPDISWEYPVRPRDENSPRGNWFYPPQFFNGIEIGGGDDAPPRPLKDVKGWCLARVIELNLPLRNFPGRENWRCDMSYSEPSSLVEMKAVDGSLKRPLGLIEQPSVVALRFGESLGCGIGSRLGGGSAALTRTALYPSSNGSRSRKQGQYPSDVDVSLGKLDIRLGKSKLLFVVGLLGCFLCVCLLPFISSPSLVIGKGTDNGNAGPPLKACLLITGWFVAAQLFGFLAFVGYMGVP
jgi:hypothetical protein